MPVVSRPVLLTKTRQPIIWAFATTLSGVLDTKLLTEAVTLVQSEKKRNPHLVAWLIDAQGVTSIDASAKIQIFIQLVALRSLGIHTAGIILPVLDADDMRTIQSKLPSGAMVFFNAKDAQAWFDKGCVK